MNIFKFLTFLFFINIFYNCSHLNKDIAPNPSTLKFHRMEFDIINKGKIKKEIGIGNIFLKEGQELDGVSFTIYGIYRGILNISSNACGIDISTNFEGKTNFNIKDLVITATTCSIKFVAITDPIDGKEHNIIETGVIKIKVVPNYIKGVSFEYFRTTSAAIKKYEFFGQGSIQRKEGDLTSNEKFTILADLTDGGIFRVNGCGFEKTGSFDKSSFDIILKELYKKSNLTREDSCDFEVSVIPNAKPESYRGRFSINIYASNAVKLEPLQYRVGRSCGRKKVILTGRPHVIVCGINNSIFFNKKKGKGIKCSARYKSEKTYWIRSITNNARKNIFAIKKGKVIWEE